MPLRIHFTSADLGRVTVAGTPDRAWETVLSLHRLQAAASPPAYTAWRGRLLRQATEPGLHKALRVLRTLVAPRGSFPDFLTPEDGADYPAAVSEFRRTSRRRLRREVEQLHPHRPASWIRRLAEGEREIVDAVGGLMLHYHRTAIGPHSAAITEAVEGDRALRTRDLLAGGIDGLFANLPGKLRWDGSVLETAYPVDRDLRLDGRGLRLVPSYFCCTAPVTLVDHDLPPVLVYPAAFDREQRGMSAQSIDPLAALLGMTRASVLQALCTPCSTTELAHRVGTTIGSASKHTSLLRASALITSNRERNQVIHQTTTLGRDLITANLAAAR